MKKILMVFTLAFISVITLCSFTVDATLKNEEHGQSLFLYSDGTYVVTISNGQRGTGKYDLKDGKIYIKWNNGNNQQGSYTWDKGVTSVYIEGVRYSVGRRVVSRRR